MFLFFTQVFHILINLYYRQLDLLWYRFTKSDKILETHSVDIEYFYFKHL